MCTLPLTSSKGSDMSPRTIFHSLLILSSWTLLLVSSFCLGLFVFVEVDGVVLDEVVKLGTFCVRCKTFPSTSNYRIYHF